VSDANVDARCDGQRSVPRILTHLAAPLSGAIQFKKQYVAAERNPVLTFVGTLIDGMSLETMAL
jgi:hypothetical protein